MLLYEWGSPVGHYSSVPSSGRSRLHCSETLRSAHCSALSTWHASAALRNARNSGWLAVARQVRSGVVRTRAATRGAHVRTSAPRASHARAFFWRKVLGACYSSENQVLTLAR